jgi:CRISPR-associated protein Cas2
MRIIVFFDLPVVTKKDRKIYSKFRKFLIQSGFDMIQFSVYARTTRNNDDAKKHIALVDRSKPLKGSVRVLSVTEKQYASMLILVGKRTATENFLEIKDLIEL